MSKNLHDVTLNRFAVRNVKTVDSNQIDLNILICIYSLCYIYVTRVVSSKTSKIRK